MEGGKDEEHSLVGSENGWLGLLNSVRTKCCLSFAVFVLSLLFLFGEGRNRVVLLW